MAWSLLSATHKVRHSDIPELMNQLIQCMKIILAQQNRDDRISHLVEVMDDIYYFVHEAEPVNKINSHKDIIAVMIKQTTECAYFIRDYAMDKNFGRLSFTLWLYHTTMSLASPGKRAVRNSFISDVDSKIDTYEDKFKELKSAFQGRAILQTEIAVMRLLSNFESLGV